MKFKFRKLSAIILTVLISISIVGISSNRVQGITPSEIVLFEGWNLIGLPCMPEDPSIEVVLSEIIDYVESVWAFDGETKTWVAYSPGAPSNLVEMVDDKGYWINMRASVVLTIYELDAPPEEGEPGYSRFFPADIGTPVTCIYEYLYQNYSAVITIKELIRGSEAWSMIRDTNRYNDPPSEGYEYILVKIKFELVSAPTAETHYRIYGEQFDAVSSDGLVYENPWVVTPEPDLDIELYPEAFYEGWAAYEIYETDSYPVLAFGRDFYGEGGVWFKLYEES